MNKKMIKKQISQWLKNTKVAKAGDLKIDFAADGDFAYEEMENKVLIGDYENREQHPYFIQLYKDLGLTGDWTPETMALLHELGHYHTHGDFTFEQEEEDNRIREMLYKMMESNNAATIEKAYSLYYILLDQEIEATRWAVDFANKHPKATRKLEIALHN